MRQKLGLVSDAAIIVVAMLFTYTLFRDRYQAPHWEQDSVKIGDTLPTLNGIAWGDADETLLLFLKKGCHFCEDSAPFYRRLLAMKGSGQVQASIVMAFPDDDESVRALTQSEGLVGLSLAGVSPNRLKVRSTPTLILVGRDGNVIRSWVGMLSPKQELEVIEGVQSFRKPTPQ